MFGKQHPRGAFLLCRTAFLYNKKAPDTLSYASGTTVHRGSTRISSVLLSHTMRFFRTHRAAHIHPAALSKTKSSFDDNGVTGPY
jgi:hypothetical protein